MDSIIINAKDAIRELDDLIEKCQQVTSYEKSIQEARKSGHFRAEYTLLEKRASIY